MKRVDVGRRDEADELPGNDGCQASGSSARLRSGEDSKHTHTQVKFKSISAICKVKTDLTLLDDGTIPFQFYQIWKTTLKRNPILASRCAIRICHVTVSLAYAVNLNLKLPVMCLEALLVLEVLWRIWQGSAFAAY